MGVSQSQGIFRGCEQLGLWLFGGVYVTAPGPQKRNVLLAMVSSFCSTTLRGDSTTSSNMSWGAKGSGLGCRVWGLGFRIWGSGFRHSGFRVRVWAIKVSGFRAKGLRLV